MRIGRSVAELCFSGDCSIGVATLVDFRPRFGVVAATAAAGGVVVAGVNAGCCCPPVVRRVGLATVGDFSIGEVCLRRVFTVGTVCGVMGRLKLGYIYIYLY